MERLGFLHGVADGASYLRIDAEQRGLIATVCYAQRGWELHTYGPYRVHYVTGDLTHVLVSAEVEGLL